MEKKLSDYLHLYGIDCPIMTPDGLGGVLVIYPKAVEVSLNVIEYQQQMKGRKGGGEMHYKYFYPEVKPILRALSSMTEEEAIEMVGLSESEGDYNDVKTYRNKFNDIIVTWQGSHESRDEFNATGELFYCADQYQWLLKKGFDLYHLIEDGHAIDSTQQPITQDK